MALFHCQTALTPEGWRDDVLVETGADGLISALRTGPAPPSAERLTGIVLPGLPNLHAHAFQRGMAGLTEHAGASEDSFWTWRELMYRFLSALTPADVETIAAMAYAEMLESGFTTVGEFHYLHHDPAGAPYASLAEMAERIAAAAAATGIGLALLPCFYAHGNFGGAPPSAGQRRFLNDIERFARLHEASRKTLAMLPWSRIGLAPHSLRAVSLTELAALLAAHPVGPVHIHVSEQTKEVEDCLAVHGRRPVDLLFDSAEIGTRFCLIHATHAQARERRRIVGSGAIVGLCPVTEANLGDGLFDGRDFLARGGRFGIGTDSNVAISAPEELRQFEYGQRLLHRRRNALAPRLSSSGRTLYERALMGGAQALALGPAGLAIGARADFVVLDPDHTAFAGRAGDRLLDSLVFVAGAKAIREVWSLGTRVVESGRHIARDAIEAAFKTCVTRLLA